MTWGHGGAKKVTDSTKSVPMAYFRRIFLQLPNFRQPHSSAGQRVERVRNIPAFQVSASITSCPAHHESQHRASAATAPAAVRAFSAYPLSVAGQHLTARLNRCILSRPADSDQRANKTIEILYPILTEHLAAVAAQRILEELYVRMRSRWIGPRNRKPSPKLGQRSRVWNRWTNPPPHWKLALQQYVVLDGFDQTPSRDIRNVLNFPGGVRAGPDYGSSNNNHELKLVHQCSLPCYEDICELHYLLQLIPPDEIFYPTMSTNHLLAFPPNVR
ncbi:hypothetical protein DAPPUDRAFT_251806 [Daphnia pulex]|uniref:Uncharacterized protein n=1 Tax=Daphnia pulex TaxID=6669 RepID=E9H160_DAPPU|nr:hypothetical protein DAPPUDRAFT_251806 [Daphnia pulex]|eukprot:EFX74575.1 hypothetical protein DAPPUDRAFT_251806 [Daphnia pulex]